MLWRCPACQSAIQHEAEAKPRPNTSYRCPVCRLELQLNPATDRFDVVPLPADDTQTERLKRR